MRYDLGIITLLLILTNLVKADSDIDTIPRVAAFLSRYIQHESITGNERNAGMFLASRSSRKGLHVEVFTDAQDSYNFAASLYPLDMMKPNIIFLNHIDVVPAENEADFTHPPFSGTIADGMVWGRGAIDNKGMAVMQLLAIERYVELAQIEDLPYNITMLSVSGEETGGHTGAKIITDRYLDRLNPIVVYGEGGTGIPKLLKRDPERKVFAVSTTFKRRLWLKLTLYISTSGHGSVTPKSYATKDKVLSMNRLVNWSHRVKFSKSTQLMFHELGQLEGGVRGTILKNVGFFRSIVVPTLKKDEVIHSLITNTITITAVNTPPNQPNQIPQEISVVLDCRLLPEVETKDFLRKIERVIRNKDIKVEIIHEDIFAKPTELDDFYEKILVAIKTIFPGSGVLPVLNPASNDNNYFRAKGLPVYGILPVFMEMRHLESIHNIDERIPIEALIDGLNVYTELIGQFLVK